MASKSSKLSNAIKVAVAVSGLALILAIPAAAEIRMNTTGGTSCKGSSGFGATVFYFSNQSAENTSGSGQYVTCEIPTVFRASPTTPNRVEVVFNNPTGAVASITCAIQTGYEIAASSADVVTAIYNFDVAANGVSALDARSTSTPVLPEADSGYDPYTMTCLVPAGVKLGLIAVRLPGTIPADI
jgi:hypothetical protein